MTTFLLIRHGETDAVGRLMAGWQPGWHLNENGKRQVERLAQRLAALSIRAVYTSPLERAVETAEAIARQHALASRKLEELGEFHMGEWQGWNMTDLESREDWRRFNSFRSGTRAPGGELIVETQTRMVRQLECLARQHPAETVAVVSHGDPLRAALAYFLGIPLDFLGRFEINPGSLSILQLNELGAACSVSTTPARSPV